MRESKKSQAEWLERYKVAGSIYAQDPCGCVMFIMVDMPEEITAASKDIAQQLSMGREIKRCARADLPPHYCEAHAPEGWTR